MEEEIAFVEKEIQRLEDISKKTYYRLTYFRRIRKRLEEQDPKKSSKITKLTQLTFFGT